MCLQWRNAGQPVVILCILWYNGASFGGLRNASMTHFSCHAASLHKVIHLQVPTAQLTHILMEEDNRAGVLFLFWLKARQGLMRG